MNRIIGQVIRRWDEFVRGMDGSRALQLITCGAPQQPHSLDQRLRFNVTMRHLIKLCEHQLKLELAASAERLGVARSPSLKQFIISQGGSGSDNDVARLSVAMGFAGATRECPRVLLMNVSDHSLKRERSSFDVVGTLHSSLDS